MARIQDITNALVKLEAFKVKSDDNGMNVGELHSIKSEVIRSVPQFLSDAGKGRVIHDDDCIILSAPKIIIGNVDKNGRLVGSHSEILMRGEKLQLEATGDQEGVGGSIECRAASIRQLAVDPGIDGMENYVCKRRSEIVSQAHNINLYGSEDFDGMFISTPLSRNVGISARQENQDAAGNKPSCGVTIHSDQGMQIDASPSFYEISEQRDEMIRNLETDIERLKQEKNDSYITIMDFLLEIEGILDQDENFERVEDNVRTKNLDLEWLNFKLETIAPLFNNRFNEYYHTCAELANKSMMLKRLQKINFVEKKEQFEADSNNTQINIFSESISLASRDSDGHPCQSPKAEIKIESPNTLLENYWNGKTQILSQDVTINTNRFVKENVEGKWVAKESQSKGSVKIIANQMLMAGWCQDYEKDSIGVDKTSCLTMNYANTYIDASDASDDEGKPDDANSGKAFGRVSINAKDIEISAYDFDPANSNVAKLCEDGNISICANNMEVGGSGGRVLNGSSAKDVQAQNISIHASTNVSAYISPEGKEYDGSTSGMILTPPSASLMRNMDYGFIAEEKESQVLGTSVISVKDEGVSIDKALNCGDTITAKGDIGTAVNVNCQKINSASPSSVGSLPKAISDKIEQPAKELADSFKNNNEALKQEADNSLEIAKKNMLDAVNEVLKMNEESLKFAWDAVDKEYIQSLIDRCKEKTDLIKKAKTELELSKL